jgi:DNA-binding NarL/FixJ family response regulator
MSKLRVLLADDHRVMLAALSRLLERSDRFDIVGVIRVGSEVVPAVRRLSPDVVLLDVRMPKLDGIACLARLANLHPETAVVIVSTYADEATIEAARAGGARGYLVKTIDPAQLPDLVERAARRDEEFFVGGLPEAAAEAPEHGLSERELAVLRALAQGLSNKQIGRELWVSEQTIKFHLRNIYRKLEVSSRGAAARYALAHGLLEPAGATAPTLARR